MEIKKLRKITIDYTDTGIFGIEEIEGYVELHLMELDGSRTIVIRTEPTHVHPNFKPIAEEQLG